MAFAAALSTHPVSSYATGEVVGQLLETLGPGPDLLVVLATPGHRGALEDIVATIRSLLEPATLLAAVTVGLGVGDEWVAPGPGLAAWAGACGPLVPLGGGTRWPGPSVVAAVAGAVVLGVGEPPAELAAWRRTGVPVLAGTVTGPVSLDGAPPGPGPAGVIFGPRSGLGVVVARGLRSVGPALEVTRTERGMIYELDGRPALEGLIDLARNRVPAADLARLALGLHLRVTRGASGPLEAPRPVLGVDRTNGAIAVADRDVDAGAPPPLRTGDIVQFTVPDPAGLRTDLERAIDATPAGALVLSTGMGADREDRSEIPYPLPAATLTCAVAAPAEAAGSAATRVTTAAVAHFPRIRRPR